MTVKTKHTDGITKEQTVEFWMMVVFMGTLWATALFVGWEACAYVGFVSALAVSDLAAYRLDPVFDAPPAEEPPL